MFHGSELPYLVKKQVSKFVTLTDIWL